MTADQVVANTINIPVATPPIPSKIDHFSSEIIDDVEASNSNTNNSNIKICSKLNVMDSEIIDDVDLSASEFSQISANDIDQSKKAKKRVFA